MLQVIIFIVSVLLVNVSGWAACEEVAFPDSYGKTCYGICTGDGPKPCYPASHYNNANYDYYFVEKLAYGCDCSHGGSGDITPKVCIYQKCPKGETPQSSSSVVSSSSQGGPPLGGSCNFCRDTVDYSEFPPQVKHVIWACDSCTAGEEGIDAGRCAVSSVGLGSCEDNNECPSGTICMDDSTSNYDCYAVIGANVYVRNRQNGNVFACEADGSCDMALRKVASGECKDPSIGGDNGEEGDSSSSGAEGSSSSSGAENGQGPWGLETTSELIAANTQKIAENTGDIANYTQETMNKAIDIYNQQTEMQIDLSHVRTNTENTATNTGNIDTKLSTTNNLLNDIKNKNWSPQIHVGSPEVNVEVKGDTNIITVQGDTNIINADTSHSPFEILQFLKEVFSGDTSSGINPNDTVGTADSVNTLLGSLFGDSLNQYNSDSLAVARNGYGAAFRAYKDTLNGIMRDSLNAWNNTLLNNGVLSGNGSDACPAFLMTQKTLAFGSLFTVQLPPLGQILCNPMPHTGITFWGLARTLLRMLVAIACMWWIYHAVIGSRGNDDED